MKIYDEIINGSRSKSLFLDVHEPLKKSNNIIIFSHGFKGFKDWGTFNEMASFFASKGYIFIKFNFSYNGTSIESPANFVDLDAFASNNFTTELDDLGLVIDWASNRYKNLAISLFGHSRGGAISILKSAEDSRIKSLITWSSPSDLLKRISKNNRLKKWKKDGVVYIFNSRTLQNMPMNYQFYEDCLNNSERLCMQNAIKSISIPHLIVHGDEDSTVSIGEAKQMKQLNKNVSMIVIKGADHVFNSYHPYIKSKMPENLQSAIDESILFLKSQ